MCFPLMITYLLQIVGHSYLIISGLCINIPYVNTFIYFKKKSGNIGLVVQFFKDKKNRNLVFKCLGAWPESQTQSHISYLTLTLYPYN